MRKSGHARTHARTTETRKTELKQRRLIRKQKGIGRTNSGRCYRNYGSVPRRSDKVLFDPTFTSFARLSIRDRATRLFGLKRWTKTERFGTKHETSLKVRRLFVVQKTTAPHHHPRKSNRVQSLHYQYMYMCATVFRFFSVGTFELANTMSL